MTQESSQPSDSAMNSISIGLVVPKSRELKAREIYLIIDDGSFLRFLVAEKFP